MHMQDPIAQQQSDYVSIATVNRRYTRNDDSANTNAKGYKYNTHDLSKMIQSSLQSLRLIAQLSAMYQLSGYEGESVLIIDKEYCCGRGSVLIIDKSIVVNNV